MKLQNEYSSNVANPWQWIWGEQNYGENLLTSEISFAAFNNKNLQFQPLAASILFTGEKVTRCSGQGP